MSTTTRRQPATIAESGTTSDAIRSAGHAAFGLQLPAAFTGTSISFTVTTDPDAESPTYQALYELDDAATGTQRQVTLAVTQGRSYDLPAALAAWPAFKIVSNASEGAARALVVVGKAP